MIKPTAAFEVDFQKLRFGWSLLRWESFSWFRRSYKSTFGQVYVSSWLVFTSLSFDDHRCFYTPFLLTEFSICDIRLSILRLGRQTVRHCSCTAFSFLHKTLQADIKLGYTELQQKTAATFSLPAGSLPTFKCLFKNVTLSGLEVTL